MSAMRTEIAEQPEVVARLARDLRPFETAAREARAAGARFVLYAARGTSDNAAVYGKYLATVLAGVPAGLATPSAVTVYGAAVDFRDCLVVGISQSGETPDVARLPHGRPRRRSLHRRRDQRREQPAGRGGAPGAGHGRRGGAGGSRHQDVHGPAGGPGGVLGRVD